MISLSRPVSGTPVLRLDPPRSRQVVQAHAAGLRTDHIIASYACPRLVPQRDDRGLFCGAISQTQPQSAVSDQFSTAVALGKSLGLYVRLPAAVVWPASQGCASVELKSALSVWKSTSSGGELGQFFVTVAKNVARFTRKR